MEKRTQNHIKKIAITGPECSGKTTLSNELATIFKSPLVPEFARNYLSNLNRPYTNEDVELIAKGQLESEKKWLTQATKFIFCDTDLLVIKIWMDVRFKSCPEWISQFLKSTPYTLHLLCKPDLPWVADPQRENPHDRDLLFYLYKKSLDDLQLPYVIIDGIGKTRTEKALQAITHL